MLGEKQHPCRVNWLSYGLLFGLEMNFVCGQLTRFPFVVNCNINENSLGCAVAKSNWFRGYFFNPDFHIYRERTAASTNTACMTTHHVADGNGFEKCHTVHPDGHYRAST